MPLTLMESINLPLQKVHYGLIFLPLTLMESITGPLTISIKESHITVTLFHYKTMKYFL
jgi:hypothetical protein